jgi:ABC-type Fe3+-hydroxamate transport system substrate-binding protein
MIVTQGTLSYTHFKTPFTKIVCLVPSISWYLFDLEADPMIAGISKFCSAQNDRHSKIPKFGGTKNPDLHRILSVQADLIIANKEENRKEDIEFLARYSTVYLSDVFDLESMYLMMREIGQLTKREAIALKLIEQIQSRQFQFQNDTHAVKHTNVVYLIWKNPYMTIGKDTFIHYMIHLAGFRNCFEDKTRYPVITLDEIIALQNPLILLSSEPYHFKKKHFREFSSLDCQLVDGRIFSWYGSFILQSFDYLDTFKKSLT